MTWHENMTHSDHLRNLSDSEFKAKAKAFNLRQRARALMAEADRLDPPETPADTSNTGSL